MSNEMISVIQKQQKVAGAETEAEGRVFNQRFQHNYFAELETTSYSLFVLAMRSPPDKTEIPSEIWIFS